MKTKAVILAGGLGSRLKDWTVAIPKPLLPYKGRPILERLLKLLKKQGFEEVILCVGYKSDLIQAYFGDGKKLGLKIYYLKEKERLGTAGPLRLVRDKFMVDNPKKDSDDLMLVLNGDLITDTDFKKMVLFHKRKKADLLIGTKEEEYKTKNGVILENYKDNSIIKIEEKPTIKYRINTGMYVINPRILDMVKPNKYCDMPDLIKFALAVKKKTLAYHITGKWKAIDRLEDCREER